MKIKLKKKKKKSAYISCLQTFDGMGVQHTDNLHNSVNVSVLRHSNNKAAVECEDLSSDINPPKKR